MMVGEFNCVAQRVAEHFEGALRGQGLTDIRRQKIQEWEAEVRGPGATVEYVADLEKSLKRAIISKDIAGENIYNSGKYGRGGNGGHRPIELIYHNGHAWSKDLHFPQTRRVYIYEGDVWEAIQPATKTRPTAVWRLGGEGRQLNVDQFILQDGRTFRTQETPNRLKKECRHLSDESLVDRASNVSHAASIKAREINS